MITTGNTEMIERDLVFVGGGHSHALVLRMLAMKPIAGVRLTLVSDTLLTPYSGMLPGYLAGHYSVEETHLDLPRLCQAAQVRFIHARVTGIDLERKQLQLADAGRAPDRTGRSSAAVRPVSRWCWRSRHALLKRGGL
jgi:NADH dehydrogenase FAD-containing subunit